MSNADETPKPVTTTGFGFKKPTVPKFGGFGLKTSNQASKNKQLTTKAAFGDDNSDDEDELDKDSTAAKNDFHRKSMNKEIQLAETKSKMDRLMQYKVQAALEQDSKIFEYTSGG